MATPPGNGRGLSEADHNIDSPQNEQQSSVPFDLPDSPEDREKLKPEVTTINLPDVSDIPGQENITVPQMGAFADTTASSDDEEGTRVFGDDTNYNDSTARTSEGSDERSGDGNVVEGTP